MKATMVKDFQWLGIHRVAGYEVRQYVAYHRNGIDKEEGLAFIMYEGEHIINVKVPLIVEYSPQDRFVVEPSAKGLRSFLGCNGFMVFITWLSDVYELQARTLIHNIFLNTKLPTSGLSAYIRDKIMEEQQ